MYGLVNKAIEGLICSEAGEEVWEQIKAKAGIEIDYFVSMNSYPDHVTYSLVGAASELLGLPAEDVLKKFGEYWVLYTAKQGYGDLLAMSGNNLKDFLMNLDKLHASVGLSFPQLQPPSFRCKEISGDVLVLEYHSARPGLAPMVVGLVNGLAKMLQTKVEITQTIIRGNGVGHDEFLIKYERH